MERNSWYLISTTVSIPILGGIKCVSNDLVSFFVQRSWTPSLSPQGAFPLQNVRDLVYMIFWKRYIHIMTVSKSPPSAGVVHMLNLQYSMYMVKRLCLRRK